VPEIFLNMSGPLEMRLSRACLTFGLSKLIEAFIILAKDGSEEPAAFCNSSLRGVTVVGFFASGLSTVCSRLSSMSITLPLIETGGLLAS